MRATKAIETTRRMVYTLPNPCVWQDVAAVFDTIRANLSGEALYDDTVRVEAEDDEIRISYDMDFGPDIEAVS